MTLSRHEIIQQVINTNGLKSYLEIGTQESISGSSIKVNKKTGVDPKPLKRVNGDYDTFFQGYSDDFFKQNKEQFDLCFVDGDHSYNQVKRDFINAWNCLEENGVIILHDSLPHCKEYTSLSWNGTVFQLVNDIHNAKLDYHIVNHDQGCTVVRKVGELPELTDSSNLTYEQYLINKQNWNIVNE